MFKENGKWFVRIFNNNELVVILSRDGNIPLDDFKDFICSKLYYGNMDKVEAGFEDYHQHANSINGNCDNLPKVVPLFGCRKKNAYNFSQNKKELGWTQAELRNNEGIHNYGGKSPVDDSVFFIRAKQSSGSSYSYSWSSNDGGNQPSEYSYSSSSGPSSGYSWSTESSSEQPSSSYSWSTESSSGQPSSSYSWSTENASNQGGNYGASNGGSSYSSSSSGKQGSNLDYNSGPSRQSNNNYASSSTGDRWKLDTFQPGDEDQCPLEYITQGFQEIAKTEIEVPVTVKKPVTTYIDVEECKTVTIPTYKKEFNMFRVAPVVVKQKLKQNLHDKYYQDYQRCEQCTGHEYLQTVEEPYVRDSDSPYLSGGYASSNVDYGLGY